jgi:cell division protein FtsW
MTRHCSIILCTAVALLVALGLIMLTSTGAWVKKIEPYHFVERQAYMAATGLVLAFFASRFPIEKLRAYSLWMLAGMCVLLVLCFVPGIADPQWGSNRWIKVPFIRQFQPSEAAKIVIMFCLASWFARWQTEIHTFWRGFIIPGCIAGIPMLLIAVETDVGTALSIAVAVGAVMFCVGTRLWFIIPTAVTVISGAGYFIMHDPVRWGRIEAWLDLENPIHQRGIGAQQWHSLLALGNGGPWGVGLGNGLEKLGSLTFAYTDFIFPVIGEEWGLRATLGVVGCYVIIALAGCGIALQAQTVFNRCLALGLTCMLVVPAMQNIAVTTASLPNDGLPLPFVSFGGTSMVFSLVAVGILVGIHRRSSQQVVQEYPLSRTTRLAVKL